MARQRFTMVLFNVLMWWNGVPVNDAGAVHSFIAQFAL